MKKSLLFLLILISGMAKAQELSIVEMNNTNLGGLQSFVHGEHQNYVVIFGGRLDGLHRRQPFAAFDIAGHNTEIQLWNTNTQNVISVSTSSFPDSIAEQIHSTNANFTQQGEYLLVAGGYGYSAIQGDHITFPRLLVFHIPTLIQAIQTNQSLLPSCIGIYHHDGFAVTGGKLVVMDNIFYLIGGHRFDGRYNPMGPDHGPGFTQVYTNAIRRFEWNINNGVVWLPEWNDPNLLHRRDFNVLSTIVPVSQQQNISIYSGVFQIGNDIPYLNAVSVQPQGFSEVPDFAQYYNHYHCGSFGVFNSSNQKMSHYFFGGIAQYYDSSGVLIQDNNVPFVRTVAKVEQAANGAWTEHLLPFQLPDYLGAGSEFIPAEGIATFSNGVIEYLPEWNNQDSVLLGYLYGGIRSSAKNIFWTNDGDLSSAAPTVFKVYYHPEHAQSVINQQSFNGWQMQVYPNPFNESIYLSIELDNSSDVIVEWRDAEGKLLETNAFNAQDAGKHEYVISNKSHWIGGTYLMTVTAEGKSFTQRVIFSD
jgi:hypothetical protein